MIFFKSQKNKKAFIESLKENIQIEVFLFVKNLKKFKNKKLKKIFNFKLNQKSFKEKNKNIRSF